MGGRAARDPRQAALVLAPGDPDGADAARRVPPGVAADRGPDRLHRRPARAGAARAGPHHPESPLGDTGGAAAVAAQHRRWGRAHALAGGQHGVEAVRARRVAGREARHPHAPVVAQATPGHRWRHRARSWPPRSPPRRWTTAPRSAPCSTRSRDLWPRSPPTAGTIRTTFTPDVAEHHPEAAIVVPPRTSGRAERDGRERADAARPPPPAHRRARPHGLAESVRLHEASPGRGERSGRWKQVIGDGLRAHTDARRATEVEAAVYTLNRMLEFGRPNYVRTA